MKKGFYGKSQEHSLCSHGVKTKQINVKQVKVPSHVSKSIINMVKRNGFKIVPGKENELVEQVINNWVKISFTDFDYMSDQLNADLFDGGDIYEYEEKGLVINIEK
jgi:hypothetical protein